MEFKVTNLEWCIAPEDCDNNPEIADEICNSLPIECIVVCDDEDDVVETLCDEFGYLIDSLSISKL